MRRDDVFPMDVVATHHTGNVWGAWIPLPDRMDLVWTCFLEQAPQHSLVFSAYMIRRLPDVTGEPGLEFRFNDMSPTPVDVSAKVVVRFNWS